MHQSLMQGTREAATAKFACETMKQNHLEPGAGM